MPAADATTSRAEERERGLNPRGAHAFDGAGHLVRALFWSAPGRSVLAAALLLAGVVTETFGIALLIPLLYAAGIGGAEGGGAGPIGEALACLAEPLGIELTLPVLLVAFVVLAGLRAGVSWQRDVQTAVLRLGFVDRLRERLYTATAAAAWPFLVRRRSSDLLHALTHDVSRAGQGAMHLIQAAVKVPFAVAQCALALAISPPFAIAVLAAGGVLLAATGPLVGRSRALGHRLTASGRATHATVSEFLGGLKLAKSDVTEARHVRDFTRRLTDMRRQQLDFIRASGVARAVLNVGAAAGIALLIGIAASRAGLSAPELLVMAVVAVRVLPALARLQQDAQQLAHVLPAWLHALEMERSLVEAAEPPAGPDMAPLPLRRALTLRGATFSYGAPSSPDPPALTEVDLTVPAHRLVAVTGPSGAGKTTLVDLLLGLIEPDVGEIRVDGTPLTGALRRRWRGSVAYVPQDPHLFHETLRTNLLRARPDASDSELWRALRLVAAEEFVAALPKRLDTVAGDRGGRLAGGERQRIVLAHALLREPALLLLDEATNQLDADTERRVLATLRSIRSRTTIVAVTHHKSVIEAADHVVRLEAGQVASVTPPPGLPLRPGATGPPEPGTRTVAARPWIHGLLAGLLTAVTSASTVEAQPRNEVDFRSEATVRAGPLYLKPAFRLERLGFESNVFAEPDPKPDFVVSAAPRVDAWLPFGRRAHVETTLIGSADWYAEHTGERAFNPEVRSRIVLPWRRLTLTGGGSWLRTRRRPNFEIDLRSNRFAKELHGGVAVRVLQRVWLDLEARQRRVGFDADAFFEGTFLSQTLNRRERSAIAALRWRPTALTTLVAASEVREVRFSRSPDRNSDNIVVTAGADFHPRALVSGSGRVGIRRFQARGASVRDISRIVADADLSFRITGNTRLTFSADRDINYSFSRRAPYYVIHRYRIAVTRRLGRRFDLSGQVGRDLYEYQTERRGRDLGWNGIGEFGFRLNPDVRTGVQVRYVNLDSATMVRRGFRGFVLGVILDYDIGA